VQLKFGFTPIVQRLENVLPSESEQAFVVPRSRWPHARLRGRCVDAAGAPIDGVGIDLEQDGRFVLVDNETLHAAADGTFDVGPLPAGQFAITPSHRECVFARVAVEVQPGDGVKELGDLVGSVPARLSVHLTGDLARVARSQVMLVLGDLRVAARGDGAERSFAVVPGRWRLAVAIDGAEVAGETIDLAAGAQAQREVALR
jgi:hypothetical protein